MTHDNAPFAARARPQDREVGSALQDALNRAVDLLSEQEACYRAERQAVHETPHPQPWKDWKLAQLEQKRARERLILEELIAALRKRSIQPAHARSLPDGTAPVPAAWTLPDADVHEGRAKRASGETEVTASLR
jgi:hypothetical protein